MYIVYNSKPKKYPQLNCEGVFDNSKKAEKFELDCLKTALNKTDWYEFLAGCQDKEDMLERIYFLVQTASDIKKQGNKMRAKKDLEYKLEKFKSDLIDLYENLIIEVLYDDEKITEDQIEYVCKKTFKSEGFYQTISALFEKMTLDENQIFTLLEKDAEEAAEFIKEDLEFIKEHLDELKNQQ